MIKNITKDKSYIRPKHTVQDKLTEEEIEQILEDYTEVENISNVAINTHLRYYTIQQNKDGEIIKLFRLGGNLKNKDNCDKYIILTNNMVSWSVQVKNTIFYRKMKINEIKDEYEIIIQELRDDNILLKKENKKLMKINDVKDEYENTIQELRKENKKLMKTINELKKK